MNLDLLDAILQWAFLESKFQGLSLKVACFYGLYLFCNVFYFGMWNLTRSGLEAQALKKSPSGVSSSSSSNGHVSPQILVDSFMSQGYRAQLPCPAPSGSEVPTLWTILRKNIGKDLSRISMPVTLNEPLGVLQRMCEGLEYSELLDAASKTQAWPQIMRI